MVFLLIEQGLLVGQEQMQNDIDEAISTLYTNDRIRKFEELNGKPFNPNSTVQLRSFCLISWASTLLERKLARAQTLLMRKCLKNSPSIGRTKTDLGYTTKI